MASPSSQVFADRELHDRLFAVSKAISKATAETAERVAGMRDTFLDLGDTYAVYAGKGSFLTQAKGVFRPDQIVAVQEFFRAHETTWEAILTPFAGTDALKNVLAVGGAPEQWEGVLYRLSSDPFPVGGEADIRMAAGPDVRLHQHVMQQGFFAGETNEMLEQMALIYGNIPDTMRYLAYLEGTPAAGAALMVIDRVAHLSGAATLPEYRGRGLQGALITRRLRDAAELSDLTVIGCAPGSSSQRNAERYGFRLAYSLLSLRVP